MTPLLWFWTFFMSLLGIGLGLLACAVIGCIGFVLFCAVRDGLDRLGNAAGGN